MDNPEKLATLGTQDEDKQNKSTTQYALDTTIHKQTEITGKCPDTISNEELHRRAETTKASEIIIQK